MLEPPPKGGGFLEEVKKRGLFIFTCGSTGRKEHGTMKSDKGFCSPFTCKILEWKDYYKNISEDDIRKIIKIDDIFEKYEFNYLSSSCDLRFYGIKSRKI